MLKKTTCEYRYLFVLGRRFELKFCKTCQLVRPIGGSHCKYCDYCVDKYDHHCPWIGNCIGKLNFHLYYSYIIVLFSLYSVNILIEALFVCSEEGTLSLVFGYISLFISSFIFLFLLVLIYFHTSFIFNNQTTYIKGKLNHILFLFSSPFIRNTIWRNINYKLFRFRKPFINLQRIKPKSRSPISLDSLVIL